MKPKLKAVPGGAPAVRHRGGRPPRRSVDGLSPGQERALSADLRLKLPTAAADRLLCAIRDWFSYGPRSAAPEATQLRDDQRLHFGRVATLSRALQQALRREHPLWNTAGIDWPGLDAVLGRVNRSAAEESHAPPPLSHRAALEWREDLIALVRDHWPADRLTVSWSSPFVTTIAMLLGFLGENDDPANVATQVRRTLKRAPRSPFIVHE